MRSTKYKDCLKDENTIVFSTGSSAFEKIKVIIQNKKAELKKESKNIVVQENVSAADELL
jgi:ribosomal protein L10